MLTPDKEFPNYSEYDPYLVPWTGKAITEIKRDFDYSLGVHECLFSGTVGSAKSLFGCHVISDHLFENERARGLIGRISMPDLKETLIDNFHDHFDGVLVRGQDYEFNEQKQRWDFWNGSRLVSRSWHKRKWTSMKSLKLSIVGIEEAAENDGEYFPHYNALYARLGRAKIDQNLMLSWCNPDSPAHPLYKKMIIGAETDPLKHVYYSNAKDNPFLPKTYIPGLIKNLSQLEIARDIEGRWVEDPKGGIYYSYSRERQYRNETYIFDLNYPIDIMHDFNIGVGKPMSAAVGQRINGVFHIAKTYIVEGADTHEIMEEMVSDGLFKRNTLFRVFGDASGKNRDPRSKTTDYKIIENVLKRNGVNYKLHVPKANPPIRTRHNRVNAKCCNFEGKAQLYIYKEAEPADEGFRMTKLKKGGQYLEDDTLEQQHVTTAIGYWVTRLTQEDVRGKSKTIQL